MKNNYSGPAALSWKQLLLPALLLFAVGFLAYVGTLGYDFLKDDFRLIVENHRIKSFQAFCDSIDKKFFTFPDFPYLHYWRPMTLFTFFVDYTLWELDPFGYHLFNVLLNACICVFVFFIFYYFTEKRTPSFFIACLFALHPSHVEAVTWVSGRTDLLSAFFIFPATLFFLLWLKKQKNRYYVFSICFFLLALLSKENAVLFPLVAVGLFLLTRVDQKTHPSATGGDCRHRPWSLKFAILRVLPFFVLDFIYIVVHNTFSGIQNAVADFSFRHTFLIFKTIGIYTKFILTPFLPSPYFSMVSFDLHKWEYYAFFLVALAVLALVIVKRDIYRNSLFSIVFLVFLLPVLDPDIVPSYPKIVIRFVYIPAVFAGAFLMDIVAYLKSKVPQVHSGGLKPVTRKAMY
ncbi:MAG: hypothetical protein GY765_03990, partial [bacterium]|nr:hypothetical protein [bacterium]